MIKAILTTGKRVYVPLSRVISISEDDEGRLTMSNLNANGEVSWREIESFEVLSPGRKQS